MARLTCRDIGTIVAIDCARFPVERGVDAWGGESFFVSTAGDDRGDGSAARPWRTLSHATTAAPEGALILVQGGEYRETADDVTALTLKKRGQTIAVRAGDIATLRPSSPTQNYGVAPEADDIEIRGLRIVGFRSGVALWTGGRRTQRNLVLAGIEVDGQRRRGAEGILQYMDNRTPGEDESRAPATLEGLLLRDVTVRGVEMGIACNGGPCRNWYLDGVRVDAVRVGNNSGLDAFAIESGDHIVVVGSQFGGASGDGIDIKGTRAVVVNSVVRNVARNGVKLWRGGDVVQTLIDGTGADAALVVQGPARFRLAHSIVAHHAWPTGNGYVATIGYDDVGEFDVEIVNSVFFENASGGIYLPPGGRAVVRNNAFYRMQRKLFDRAGDEILVTDGAAAIRARGWGDGNLVEVDPLFIDAGVGDYRPSYASPLRDHGGIASPLPPTDAAGYPRNQGASPDIGLYEITP